MKYIVSLFITLFLAILSFECPGQQDPRFSKPALILKDGYLLISYDILGSQPSEEYQIRIEATDSQGDIIEARSITGDIGPGVSGGDKKLIQWDVGADGVAMDRGVYVQVIGEKTSVNNSVAEFREISRMGAVVRSAAFPGWGLSKLNPGKPHWVKGVAAYGALGSSFILNQQSYLNYQNYLDSTDETERSNFYDKSNRQEQLSVVVAFASAGIWAADLLWTFIGAKTRVMDSAGIQPKRISIGTDYETAANIPLLSLRYVF